MWEESLSSVTVFGQCCDGEVWAPQEYETGQVLVYKVPGIHRALGSSIHIISEIFSDKQVPATGLFAFSS